MPVPIIGAGFTAAQTAGRGLAAYLAKKKLQKELALKAALAGGRGAAINASSSLDTAATYGARLGAGGLIGALVYDQLKEKNKDNKDVTIEDINNAWQGLPNAKNLNKIDNFQSSEQQSLPFATDKGLQIDPNTGLRAGTGGYGITQDQRDMINHFSKIDSMNLTHQAKEMLKEDYLRKRTGAAVTEEEDYNLEKELRKETGTAYTGGELDTFMGLLRRRKSPRGEIDFDSLFR